MSDERPAPGQIELIVELLNTLDLRTYGESQRLLERDELADSDRARAWFTSHGLLEEQTLVPLERVGECRRLRDQLRAVLAGRGSGFTRLVELEMVFSGHGSPSVGPTGSGVDGAMSGLLAILTASVLNGSWARLRICGAADCQRAFFDSSRNGRARWCSMRICGNRMKTRTYRRRKASPPQGLTTQAPPRHPVHRRRSSFGREGDYWSISYAGQTFRLKDSKGLRYMAKLLAEPGREFHVLDLVSSEAPQVPPPLARASLEVLPSGGSTELIDPTARRAYRARLQDLREELAEAERWGDPARAGRAREEIDFLAAELKRATGLAGRGRSFASDSERARVSVTRVIKAALLRIGDHSPELKHHFGGTLKTGTYCSYAPDPRLPVRWEL